MEIDFSQRKKGTSRPWAMETQESFTYYGSTFQGLSSHEVKLRQEKMARNEIVDDKTSLIWEFLEKFKEPLVLLLLGSAAVSLLMGQMDDAFCIFLAVVIVSTVAFVQELKSQNAIDALKEYQAQICTVFRDNKLSEIPAEELVPGDIVLFKPGSKIPADLRIFEASSLKIDEAILTGESQVVEKIVEPVDADSTEAWQQKNMAFQGTMVMNGVGKGLVVAIGEDTLLGEIAKDLKDTQSEKTPLQLKMDDLGKQLSIISGVIIVITCVIGFFQGHSLIDMFNVGVSLAVAAIPEGLPVVVTVTLAIGVSRMAKRNAIVRRLPAVEALGGIDVICCDKTGTITENKMTVNNIFTNRFISARTTNLQGTEMEFSSENEKIDPKKDEHLQQILRIGLLCNNAHYDEMTHSLIGEPTEGALLRCAFSAGLEDTRPKFVRKTEIPFDSSTKFMAVQLETSEGIKYYVKGAFDVVFDRCQDTWVRNQSQMAIKDAHTSMASSGLRVLGIAIGADLNKLTFVGLVGISDPVRFNVKQSIKLAQDSGIRVAMITGDSKETALAIASELGIYGHNNRAMSGREMTSLPENQNPDIENVSVFYRMTPSAKFRVIEALQNRKHVVAMTGDGTNDAPSLKRATIGISMGTGTDVSKEASDIVLIDNNFSTIVAAIEEGRGIFNNIQNFIRFQLTTSFAAMGLLLYCTLTGLPLPLNPMQILWINIIMDGPPAQSLGVEPVQSSVMNKPPRDPSKPVITSEILQKVFGIGLVMILVCLYAINQFPPDGTTHRSTTISFTAFVFLQLWNAVNCRTRNSVLTISPWSNKFFVYAVGGSALMQLVVVYVPFFNYIFETEPLMLNDLLCAIFLPAVVVMIDEIWKRVQPSSE